MPLPATPDSAPRRDHGERGFSLIELIMVMILMGIAGTMASLGLVTYIRSFTASKDTNYTTGKAQLAMLRVVKEFTAIEAVTASSASAITFRSRHGATDAAAKTYILKKSGSNLILNDGADNILTDQVSVFTLGYSPTFNGTPAATWTGCNNPLSLTLDWAEWRSYLAAYKFKIQFDDTNPTHLDDYKVSYGNPTYGTTGWNTAKDYNLNNVSSSLKSFSTSPIYFYPKAYVWSVARGRECYVDITVNDANHNGLSPGGDGPPVVLSRVISITLTMLGADNTPVTFTAKVAPRNLPL